MAATKYDLMMEIANDTKHQSSEQNKAGHNKPGQLHPSWAAQIGEEINKPYMQKLRSFLRHEYLTHKTVYPKASEYFFAFEKSPFEQTRVVILGQDPYHGPGQAHGLAFSVKPGVPSPPSLQNIFKELKNDLGITIPNNGYLVPWAEQGVLLLNSTLTVRAGEPGSHQNQGWETFTDRALEVLSQKTSGIAFVLWGAFAQKKQTLLDNKKHLIIKAPHPSPLSSHRGFFGSKPFSQINDFLIAQCKDPIQWGL